MQLLGNLDIPKKQNSSGDVQPEYMDFYNSLRVVNDQGPQTIAKLVYTEANEGLLQISQTTRRNFYRPHNQHKFMVSPQRNVNFDAKKGVSELEGLTFPSTRPQRFFFFKRLEVESRQLLDVRRSCLQQLAWVFPAPLERSDIQKYFAIHFHGAFCGGDIVWDRILSQYKHPQSSKTCVWKLQKNEQWRSIMCVWKCQ